MNAKRLTTKKVLIYSTIGGLLSTGIVVTILFLIGRAKVARLKGMLDAPVDQIISLLVDSFTDAAKHPKVWFEEVSTGYPNTPVITIPHAYIQIVVPFTGEKVQTAITLVSDIVNKTTQQLIARNVLKQNNPNRWVLYATSDPNYTTISIEDI